MDARDMAQRMGVRYDEIHRARVRGLQGQHWRPTLQGPAEDTTEENIQARIRGTLLMACPTNSAASC
jgi:NAD+ synthase (glutamine-hydrolysing)